MNYGDIIEYTDGTRDLYFEDAREWCKLNNATLDELVDKRDLPLRYFQINRKPAPPAPTKEEQRQRRANAYQMEVDPITSHIQRLRDITPVDENEIAELISEREAKVIDIQNRYPYPEGE